MIETTLTKAAKELEELRQAEEIQKNKSNIDNPLKCSNHTLNVRFPSNCLKLLYGIPGNLRCLDCDVNNPQWATLSYGALLCIECSGRHRQMGVNVSVITIGLCVHLVLYSLNFSFFFQKQTKGICSSINNNGFMETFRNIGNVRRW